MALTTCEALKAGVRTAQWAGILGNVKRPEYRMFIDEVGNPGIKPSSLRHDNHRFLSLTGIVMRLEDHDNGFSTALDTLKATHFAHLPPAKVALHRTDIVNARGPFRCLKVPARRNAFDLDLKAAITGTQFSVATVVLDKRSLVARYKQWTKDPYHYGLEILLERYQVFLHQKDSVGDVMAESRGGKLDRRLAQEYKKHYLMGTRFVKEDEFQRVLTSKQLKVKPKSANIAGLQLADLIAHPSYKCMLYDRGHCPSIPPFAGWVKSHLDGCGAYITSRGYPSYGRKWLP